LRRVRVFLYGAAVLALATAISPETIRSALAASASALFEATPFLLAGVLLSRLLRRRTHAVEYLGCGCGTGPSARSLPAAAATTLLFGPVVAIARYLAALLAARLLHRGVEHRAGERHDTSHLLGELAAVLPAAVLAGAAMQIVTLFDPARLPAIANVLLGAALGFTAPCGLGAVAVAGALRVHAPVAAAAFLCVAGIVDLRALRRAPHIIVEHDALGYALLAAALAIVAWRRGDALVHPAFAAVLACCACAAASCAVTYRRCSSGVARVAPALMLVGALVGAPPLQYHATDTTLSDLFAGERLTFTGALVREGSASAVVRYAITCCRADAAPVAVRLDGTPPYPAGTWLRVDGTIESIDGNLRLVPQRIERVPAPVDPFIYR
jgi:hypothetical protein